MDVVKWLEANWNTISSAPVAYIVSMALSGFVVYKFTRSKLGDEAKAARERAEQYKDRVRDLELDKSSLFSKLQEHGEDIGRLKRELESRPRVHVGETAPKDAKDGDIWMQT